MIDLFISIFLFFLLGISSVAYGALRMANPRLIEEEKENGGLGPRLALRLLENINRVRQVFILTLFVLSFLASFLLYRCFLENINLDERLVLILSLIASLLLTGFFSAVGLEYGESEQGNRHSVKLASLSFLWSLVFSPIIWGISLFASPLAAFFVQRAKDLEEDAETPRNISQQEQQEKEDEVLQNVLRFTDRDASALMTNRSEVLWVDINDPWVELDSVIRESGYTKFPVCDDELDNVVGILRLRDFIENKEKSKEKLRQQLSEPVNVPEHMSAMRVIEIFKKERNHFAFVVDEFGTTLGIITLHDLVEYIFGALPDEDFEEEPPIIVRQDGSLLVDGTIPIEDLLNHVEIPTFRTNDDEDYNTLAGYILINMDEMPKTGDVLLSDGYRFEIVDMDRNRIDKVLINKV